MKLGYLLFYVENVEATLAFFEVAFGVERKMYDIEGEDEYGELASGETTLGFVSHHLARSQGIVYHDPQPDGPAPPMDIGFVTDDVDAAFRV